MTPSLIITAIKFLPELIALLKTITGMIKDGKSDLEIKAAIKAFDLGLDRAVRTKDTSGLEDIFRGKQK